MSAQTSMRALGRDTLVYGLGVVLSRVVSVLMLPIYTQFLTPADYGTLQLLQMTTDVAFVLFAAGTTAGVLRYYFKAESDRERNEVMSSAFVLVAALSAAAAIAVALAAPLLARHALGGAGSPGLVRLAATSFLLESLFAVPLLYVQARQRAMLFIGANAVRLLLQLALNVLFLVVLERGVAGVLIGTLIANLLVGTWLARLMLRETGLRVSRDRMRDLRRFGLPYQFVWAGTFVLTFGDRYFLQASHGAAVVGLYGLAYQFGFLVGSLGYMPVMRAWNPQRFLLAAEPRPVRDARYNEGLLYLNLVIVTLGVGLCLFSTPVITVMASAAFHPASAFVPVIVAAYLFQAWTDVAQFGIDVSEQTRYATIATWSATIAILGLYWALIPAYGAMGAALATLIAFAFRFLLFYHFAQRLWPVSYRWGPSLRLVSLAAIAVVAERLVRPASPLAQGGVASLITSAYAVATWLTVLGAHDRARILEHAGAATRRVFRPRVAA
jgi:O-antigen/teichoic acid export membrane protein